MFIDCVHRIPRYLIPFIVHSLKLPKAHTLRLADPLSMTHTTLPTIIHSLLTVYDPLFTDRLWSTLYWPFVTHSLLTVYDPHSTDCLRPTPALLAVYDSTDRLWSTLYWLSTPDPLFTDRLWSTLYWLSTTHSGSTGRLYDSTAHSLLTDYGSHSTDHL